MYKQGIIIKTNEGKDEGLIHKEDVGTPQGRTGIRISNKIKNKKLIQKKKINRNFGDYKYKINGDLINM